jgi:membrane-associated HD superfamily phosphohydrolase
MEITEKERLMLVKKKEEICRTTFQILDMTHDQKTSAEIKKDVTLILSLINTIASYSNSKNRDLDRLENAANLIFSQLDLEYYVVSECMSEVFCNAVNSMI